MPTVHLTSPRDGVEMGHPDVEFEKYAIKSYRYLRLAIVVMVVALGTSVALERADTDCWQESISAYYFTPVHAMFIGALVAIGVCLIAVKGRIEIEDALLNLAGVLALVVALVPTAPAVRVCTKIRYAHNDTESFVNNNVLALAIGGVLAVGLAYLIARFQGRTMSGKIDPAAIVGISFAIVLITAGFVWHWRDRSGFNENAHGTAAAVMFLAIGIVVAINRCKAPKKGYRVLYAVIAGFMAVVAVGVGVAKWQDPQWRHWLLWLEILEIAPFAVFWTAQTLEHWDAGIERNRSRGDATFSRI